MSRLSVSQRYAPHVDAARQARCFVQDRLQASRLESLAADVGLALSELATNAVLHARTDFEVHVYELAEAVRVEVHDGSTTAPVFTPASATAMSGRGLAMVQMLAARCGCGLKPGGGKLVWFEVGLADPPSDPLEATVDELLALWADPEEPSESTTGQVGNHDDLAVVIIPALPARRLLAAKEHMDDLLRELQLILLDPVRRGTTPPCSDPSLGIARRLDAAARAFAPARRQVREQVNRAVQQAHDHVTLRLRLAASAAADAVRYRDAVEEAEQLSHAGGLLTVSDSFGQHRQIRRCYLNQVIQQLKVDP